MTTDTTPTTNAAQRPSSAVMDDSAIISKAVAEAGMAVADLADKVTAATAELDRLAAAEADAAADAALGHRGALDAARKATAKGRATLTTLQVQHEQARRTLGALQARHRSAVRRELEAEQDRLVVAWNETHGTLMEMLPAWTAQWSRLRSLREQDAAIRRRMMTIDSPDGSSPYISPTATHGLRLVTRHPDERPLTEPETTRTADLLDNLRLQHPDEPHGSPRLP